MQPAWRPADPELAAAIRPWDFALITDSPNESLPQTLAVTHSSTPLAPGRHAARRRGPSLAGLMPDTVRQRFAFGPTQVSLVAVLVALGLGVTAWWAIHTRPQATQSGSPRISEVGPSPSALLPLESTNQVSAELIVDVSGKVRRPGIAVLSAGARVVDALEAAGGVRRGVDLGALNLARPLVDGEQILVGVPQPDGVGAAAAAPPSSNSAGDASPGALVNLNTAGQVELETLPGIGPVTALAIISWRTQNNGFGAVEELLDVQGIGEATLAQLAPHVTV